MIFYLKLFFREWKKKYDIVENDEEDTIEYEYKLTWKFRPDLSGEGLTGDEYFVMTHPLVTGIAMQIYQERKELLPFISNAINGILSNPKDIFYKGRFWDILFDGITIDCSSSRFEIDIACSEFDAGLYKEFTRFNETSFKFSLFGHVGVIKPSLDSHRNNSVNYI